MSRKTGKEEGKADGYEEGCEEGSRKWIKGYKAKGKLNKEKEERVHKEGQLEGYELSTQHGPIPPPLSTWTEIFVP